jgi:hypothetical protein
MSLSKETILSKKEYAVISQPGGLLITLIIAAIIIALFSLSLHHVQTDAELHHIEQQVHTILIEAANMFEYANEGSCVTLHVTFPKSMRFIVFGHLPQDGSIEPAQRELDENTSNNCYYVMEDGATRTFHSNARFSNDNMTQIAIFYAGTYDIILELRQQEGKTYVTMS